MKIRSSFIAFIVVLTLGVRIQGADTGAAPHRVQISAKRYAFTPAVITLTKGEPVVLSVKSTDVPHGLHFDDLNLDLQVTKGATAELRFTPDKAGDFVGHCSVFCGVGHGGMSLTLHVVD